MEHHFNVELATRYGILEAVLLNHLEFWIKKNEANGTNYYDENYWTYNSVKALGILFPYASQNRIRNALKRLEEQGLIMTGNYNKSAYDRTMWYAFTEKGKSILQNYKMDVSKSQNQNDKINTPIPDNTADNITYNKHKYGEFENVLLTDEEYEKLKKKFPTDYPRRIEDLSVYIKSKNKKYSSHYATILAWARKNNDMPRIIKAPEPEREIPEEERISDEEFAQMQEKLKSMF